MATFWPATNPASFRPCSSAATRCSEPAADVLRRNAITGIADCCARAASGQAAAEAVIALMKSRRRTRPSPERLKDDASFQSLSDQGGDVRFGSKADMCSAKSHVRFTPKSGHVQCNSACPLSANSGHGVLIPPWTVVLPFHVKPPDVLARSRAHGCAAQNPLPCRPPMSNLNGSREMTAQIKTCTGCRLPTEGESAANQRNSNPQRASHRSPILSCKTAACQCAGRLALSRKSRITIYALSSVRKMANTPKLRS